MSVFASPQTRPPLDPSLYSLDADELAFFRTQTGIEDEEDLKRHIINVQTKAYQVYGYPCIRRFGFAKLKISRLPAYPKLLALGKEREAPLFLDIACCFGNDARKAIADGYPIQSVIASDIQPDFWKLGHELFRTTHATFPVPFIPGDAFNPDFIQPREPYYGVPPAPPSDKQNLASLTPLQGTISAIHASSFFHLFDEERQLRLARQLATLLSPLPGSIIFGSHGGRPEPGLRSENLSSHGHKMFCHSPDSWRDLWDGVVFKQGTVHVEAGLIRRNDDVLSVSPSQDSEFYFMWWSVTRL